MKKIILLFFLTICFSCINHETETRYIKVTNKSKKEIYSFFMRKQMSLQAYHDESPEFINAEKGGFSLLYLIKPKWEKYIEQASDKKLKIFLIEKDSVDKYGWEKIFEKDIYNKQYNLTIDDLDKMDWQIEYP